MGRLVGQGRGGRLLGVSTGTRRPHVAVARRIRPGGPTPHAQAAVVAAAASNCEARRVRAAFVFIEDRKQDEMSNMSTRTAAPHGWWLGWLRRPIPSDSGPVERFLWGFWVLNSALFLCLVPFTLLFPEGSGLPLRVAATAGLLGACVWEAVALRARRFPFWADVLETLTVALLAWRFPAGTGPPLILFVVTFALAGLGFRILYGSRWQAALRTVTTLAAIFAGRLFSLPVY